jgi:hypothetical protein
MNFLISIGLVPMGKQDYHLFIGASPGIHRTDKTLERASLSPDLSCQGCLQGY